MAPNQWIQPGRSQLQFTDWDRSSQQGFAPPNAAGRLCGLQPLAKVVMSRNTNSWHDSYHRTMTQVASAATVLAPFDNVQLSSRGRALLPHARKATNSL